MAVQPSDKQRGKNVLPQLKHNIQSAGSGDSHLGTEVVDIPCKLPDAAGLDNLVGLLEPADRFEERYATGAFSTAVTIRNGCIPCELLIPPTNNARYIDVIR